MNKYNTLRCCLFSLIACFAIESKAKDISAIWLTMPDSVVGYLDSAKRAESLDVYEAKMYVDNLLGGKTRIDALSSDYIFAKLNSRSSLQMKLLPSADTNDSILCVVRTYDGPEKESSISLYDENWKKIRVLSFNVSDFIQKPDTMSEKEFSQRKNLIDAYLFNAKLDAENNTLKVNLEVLNLNIDDRKSVDAIILQRNLKWNGSDFN